MAPTVAPPTSGDELDDILRGIAAEGGYQPEPAASKSTNNADAGLGIDEEIAVIKKRIPNPKLDDVRLRSERGVPRLRTISKERLRFKGKGHEYGDIARMLNMYQLWLDDLYPRAKFADALAIIEKVGHTKRMQVDRKFWIDEGKPRQTSDKPEDDVGADVQNETAAQVQAETMEGLEAEDNTTAVQSGAETPVQPRASAHPSAEEPNEDELDALLAESEQRAQIAPKVLPSQARPATDDPFADEMEAMEGMEDMW
ncbi:Swi3-domain-containing protein [Didymella exigua CBS 183.55]|uniref:Chromosome segregation in meiosis protein n=1 Tax=Didymella exigua CBS 183.55 TaxID=1150837 RepID=A0A6A5S0F5_9PLEO|nr:Swi3-domain-containing protein [Didymella exigua CBS 183.55]KAF1932768.1 Swi3-domain-containing protein [Didymella exigua CBS 183.55]